MCFVKWWSSWKVSNMIVEGGRKMLMHVVRPDEPGKQAVSSPKIEFLGKRFVIVVARWIESYQRERGSVGVEYGAERVLLKGANGFQISPVSKIPLDGGIVLRVFLIACVPSIELDRPRIEASDIIAAWNYKAEVGYLLF